MLADAGRWQQLQDVAKQFLSSNPTCFCSTWGVLVVHLLSSLSLFHLWRFGAEFQPPEIDQRPRSAKVQRDRALTGFPATESWNNLKYILEEVSTCFNMFQHVSTHFGSLPVAWTIHKSDGRLIHPIKGGNVLIFVALAVCARAWYGRSRLTPLHVK